MQFLRRAAAGVGRTRDDYEKDRRLQLLRAGIAAAADGGTLPFSGDIAAGGGHRRVRQASTHPVSTSRMQRLDLTNSFPLYATNN
jgi:hypothetical protein